MTLRLLATSCAKDYKGHSLVQTSFTEPLNTNRAFTHEIDTAYLPIPLYLARAAPQFFASGRGTVKGPLPTKRTKTKTALSASIEYVTCIHRLHVMHTQSS